jgi:hypothetical protein
MSRPNFLSQPLRILLIVMAESGFLKVSTIDQHVWNPKEYVDTITAPPLATIGD